MILVNYLAAVTLLCTGLYVLLTRRNLIKIVMGLSLMEASTYLFMVSLAYRAGSTAPVLVSPPAGKKRRGADRPALPHAGRRPGPGDARMTSRAPARETI